MATHNLTSEAEKLNKISLIQQEISINKTRLVNAEQSVHLYLEKLEELNQQLFDILNKE